MSIEYMDGFDLYGTTAAMDDQWSRNSSIALDLTEGRFGGGCARITGRIQYIQRAVTPANEFVALGAAIRYSNVTDTVDLMRHADSTGTGSTDINCLLRLNPDGSLALLGDASQLKGTSAPGVFPEGVYAYIEMIFERSGSGHGEVRVNGVNVLDVPSADFLEGTGNAYVLFGHGSGGDTTFTLDYDDIYIETSPTTRPVSKGDVRISTLLPDGDTAQADFTPLAGSGFSNIDDALGTDGDGDTTYISTATVGHKSEFDMENLPVSPLAIVAVSTKMRASKTDVGAASVRSYVDSSGTEAAGVTHAPMDSVYNLKSDVFETDPNTAGVWTEASVNAVKLGVERDG